MVSDIEHLFICVLAIWMSSFEKCLFGSFVWYLIGLVFGADFCKLFISFRYYGLSDVLVYMFSHSVGCLFISLMTSFVSKTFYFNIVPFV